MQLTITGDNLPVTDALRSYATQKFERLKHRGDRITSIHLILAAEKTQQIAKATMHIAGAELHADSLEADAYSAIDTLVDKLNRQLVKHKEKLKDHQSPGLSLTEEEE